MAFGHYFLRFMRGKSKLPMTKTCSRFSGHFDNIQFVVVSLKNCACMNFLSEGTREGLE